MKRLIVLAVALLPPVGMQFLSAPAQAATCTAADFGAVVDQTAQALRTLNVDGAQRFQTKLAGLREKHSLSDSEIEARTASLNDTKIDEFNAEIDSLVGQMDALSQTPNNQVTCDKLDSLRRVRDRLLTVMGQKSGYMQARADVLFDKPATAQPVKPGGTAQPAAPVVSAPVQQTAQPAKPETVKPAPANEPKIATAPATPAAPALPERRPAKPSSGGWTPENRPTDPAKIASAQPQGLQPPPAGTAPGDAPALPPPGQGVATYDMNEIREAGRGIFGTITAEFAGAINYAFQQFGQPNAYIDGNEGGGAFLAGLRYGKGTLHRKGTPQSKIYWQGPSAGLDLGAEGSNTLFLVYNLDDPNTIYGRFSGIGGAAYVAGGVGINVLGKGKVVIVPIRSGVGLRLGASLAYLKFTERQTWNPF